MLHTWPLSLVCHPILKRQILDLTHRQHRHPMRYLPSVDSSPNPWWIFPSNHKTSSMAYVLFLLKSSRQSPRHHIWSNNDEIIVTTTYKLWSHPLLTCIYSEAPNKWIEWVNGSTKLEQLRWTSFQFYTRLTKMCIFHTHASSVIQSVLKLMISYLKKFKP